jgi:HAD superfamily hydrolase (TIGR01484 family)
MLINNTSGKEKCGLIDMSGKTILLVADLDGTIIRSGEPIDEELASILKKYREESRLLIATGRHPLAVKFVLQTALGFVPTISLNGGGLNLYSWSRFDRVIYFPSDTVKAVSRELSGFDVTISYYGEEFWAVSKLSPYVERESIVTGMIPSTWRDQYLSRCVKILVMCEPSMIKIIRAHIKRQLSDLIQISESLKAYLEISPPSVNKVTLIFHFLKKIIAEKKLTPYIVFVGDSENDIDCAKFANESWTFPSSSRKLKEVCTGILDYDNGLGVKNLLRDLGQK